MQYYKLVINNYIDAVSVTPIGEEIKESEYFDILAAMKKAPDPVDGYMRKLRNDSLEWELVELPEPTEEPEELDAETALKKLYSMLTKTQVEKVSKDEDLYNYLQKMEMKK